MAQIKAYRKHLLFQGESIRFNYFLEVLTRILCAYFLNTGNRFAIKPEMSVNQLKMAIASF